MTAQLRIYGSVQDEGEIKEVTEIFSDDDFVFIDIDYDAYMHHSGISLTFRQETHDSKNCVFSVSIGDSMNLEALHQFLGMALAHMKEARESDV